MVKIAYCTEEFDVVDIIERLFQRNNIPDELSFEIRTLDLDRATLS
jgi:hypothetical protein